jgi:hypothetical protein
MSNPWDPYPFPAAADEDPRDTYYGVGVVISGWESIEFEFARLYSVFKGLGPKNGDAIQEYGTGRIFRERADALSTLSERYFTKNCNQAHEAEYAKLLVAAVGFSARRNEVAHGIVINVAGIAYFKMRMPLLDPNKVQTVVIPPYYTIRFHDPGGFPSYAYNKLQLEGLAVKLREVEIAIRQFRESLHP